MAAINFPISPVPNQTFDAENGIRYTWDGTKWTLKAGPEDFQNYWSRNSVNEELQPRVFDDLIVFSDLAVNRLQDTPD